TEPLEIPLQKLFAAHAARTPDASAVAYGDELVTYGALKRRADRLAGHLATLGVGPECVVAVAMERSVELIVAVLGTLTAGGAYLPLDPGYPRERLAFMLEDSGAKVLLTQEALLGDLPAFRGDTVCLGAGDDAVAAAAPRSPRGPVELTAELASPAYVIYTSGSTGRPKAVVVPHRGLANLAPVQARLFGVGPGSRVLQFASPSFDASVSEIAMSLGSGALIRLAPRESLLPGADLERLLRERAITTVTLPPSALALLWDEALPDLACLVVAGEACPVDLAARWSAGRRFVNAYGPSEGTVCATAGEVGGRRLDIGRPIANVEVHLLDRHLQPVPVSVPGELCLGGVGVARGYLGRPDLTAERFIPHALDGPRGESGGRLYRTGDLARWLPDGSLQFLGRIDRQVKVRGFRIEPGEIEALLRRQPAVRDAVVEVRGDTQDGGRLVAYVVPAGGAASVPAGALRDALRGALPEHMVPAAFVMLEALPLTPNGKVDRRALPAPNLAPAASYAAPRDPVEEVVADVWSELLAVERVGIHDDFFGLGGHSLLGARLMSRLFHVFGVELPLRALFEFPTVAGLAAQLAAALRQGAGSETPPIERVEGEAEAPLSFAQQRLWWIHQLEPESPAYNLPVALRLHGRFIPQLLEAALGEIVRRHEVLRTTFPAVEGRPVQRISPPRPLRSPLVDLSGLPGPRAEAAAAELAGAEALRAFDLSSGPLLRVALLRLGGDDHVLLFTLHHIVSDGWSTGVLVREAGELYRAFLAGRPSPLPPLPIQYADFARWQRRWLQGEVLSGQLAYWTSRLAGAPSVLELPADRPRPAVLSGRGGVREILLPADLTAALAALGRREGATLFMTLLAAFYLLLSRYTGRIDLVVGTDVANRSRAETEDLIGFFINQLVLRADLAGDPPFRELLGRVREMALEAYARQDLPFDRLVEELRPERDLSRQPVFQVFFTLQNLPRVPLELPGLTSSLLAAGGGTAKFDLSVGVKEEPAGLRVSAEYSSDLFDAATIDRLLGHFAALLGSAAAAPGTRLSGLEILPAAE
ncbi:MAG TPA: amino acid adenylation domain-containing protein, partial [Thermoanaerobaculia bacterium]|nr:amino acid adenylation domain-containing protein [Thermoanaerobaculia bacterium]